MNVLLVNGSSRPNGCTQMALNEVTRALNEEGIETTQVFIGNEALPDCIACRQCRRLGRCVFEDAVNAFWRKPQPRTALYSARPSITHTPAPGC